MTHEILIMGPLMESVMGELDENYTVHKFYESENPEELLSQIADRIRAVVTDGGTGVKATVLQQLPNTRIVTVFGVGVDAVDLEYCKSNNIVVTNTPHVLSDDVADLGVALMLAVSRNVVEGDRYCRDGKWPIHGAMPLTNRMTGKRAGIFGMGSIGLRLAKRLEAFDMDVSYCNRKKRTDTHFRYYEDLTTLARETDYLIVAASASPTTEKIIDHSILEALGPDGYFINVSRGSLVNETELIAALQNGVIRGAGLDVFEQEPQIPQALVAMSNVVLQPHHASGTVETRHAMGKVVCENLACFFDDRPPVTQYFR